MSRYQALSVKKYMNAFQTGSIRFSAEWLSKRYLCIITQPAQQDSWFTSLVKVCAASFSPSTMVR